MPWENGSTGWNPRSGWEFPPTVGASGVTWDAADFQVSDTFGHARFTLSPDKLTATTINNAGSARAIIATHPISGLCRFEITASDAGVSPGLAPAALKTSASGGGLFGTPNGMLWQSTGHVRVGFTDKGIVAPTFVAGDVLAIEVDTVNKLARFIKNSGTPLPVPGVDFSAMPAGLIYPAADGGTILGVTILANFGPTWATPVTSGYGPVP